MNNYIVPKALIARADINGRYLEAVIKIQTSNAYLVPRLCENYLLKTKVVNEDLNML